MIVIGVISIISEYKQFNADSASLREEFMDSQRNLVKNQVENAIDYIEYNRSLALEKLKLNLKTRVDEAWDIANNIYIENKGKKPDSEIKKMISDALRPIRFNKGRGDIFVYTTEGVSVMLPRSRKYENLLSLDLRDSLGNYLVLNEINLLRDVDQGYLAYKAPLEKNQADSIIYKYTYVRKFTPFNWYLGSKDYLKDFEDDLKTELLRWISHIRYNNEGYIFVNTWKGEALLTNGTMPDNPLNIYKSGDSNWIYIFNRQKEIVLKSGGGYIDYKFKRLSSQDLEDKYSYIGYVKEWGWIIGAGFYQAELESQIIEKQEEIQVNINKWLIRILSLGTLFLFLAYLLARLLTRLLKVEFNTFFESFKKASIDSEVMREEEISFQEFRELASSVNKTILERDSARKDFENEQALLRSLIDSIPDFVFFKDVNSIYVGCNKAFADYLGMEEKDIIGRSDYELFGKEAAEIYHENDRRILENHIPIRNEEWVILADGSKKLLDTVKVLYVNRKGEVLGIMAISRDITEKEEIQQQYKIAKEKAEESDSLKTAFLANMSHEIRTPMNSIIGFSTLLTEEGLSEVEKSEFIQHIQQAGESLLCLIDDIIDTAKIEAGQLSITNENCQLGYLYEELNRTYADLIARKFKSEVALVAEFGNLPSGDTIITDPLRLKQVISNLLMNAVKFTSEGVITYGYKLKENNILFFVKDTGIGIAPEFQEIIFNRFRQANNEVKKHTGGTGLGLAISKHIVELMGGKIWVESKPGEGSAFYFTIPYHPAAHPENFVSSRQVKSEQLHDWSDKVILVVEDVDSNFNYINAALSRTGVKILRATDGLQSLDICLSDKKIDLVLMDMNMPNMDGYEATRIIKKQKPSLVIIAQTAYAYQDDAERCKAAGCDNYLSKPVKFNVLISTLEYYLG